MTETIELIIYNLRNLFKDKDRLVGVDDWDTFIGILITLEELEKKLQEQEKE